MQPEQLFIFGSYRFAPHTGQVWRGKQDVRLTGKAVAVLRHLVDRVGRTVTKEELFHAVWPDTVVSDAALTSCIQELRQALRDQAKRPRYIETVHRRGFRWLAPLRTTSPVSGSRFQVPSSHSPIRIPQSTIALVGRRADLTFLHEGFAKALTGERQLVFVTGEPGIGKTTLLEVFVSEVRSPRLQEESQKSKTCPEPSRRDPSQ
jgi:DNA-binding winged helix-turn-helix (wHTH) protein